MDWTLRRRGKMEGQYTGRREKRKESGKKKRMLNQREGDGGVCKDETEKQKRNEREKRRRVTERSGNKFGKFLDT